MRHLIVGPSTQPSKNASRVFCIIFATMKTPGEIESAISESMGRFELEYMGRVPKDVRAHLIEGLVVVRLKRVLTAAQ